MQARKLRWIALSCLLPAVQVAGCAAPGISNGITCSFKGESGDTVTISEASNVTVVRLLPARGGPSSSGDSETSTGNRQTKTNRPTVRKLESESQAGGRKTDTERLESESEAGGRRTDTNRLDSESEARGAPNTGARKLESESGTSRVAPIGNEGDSDVTPSRTDVGKSNSVDGITVWAWKSADKETARKGEKIAYTIQVRIHAGKDVDDLVVEDRMDARLELLRDSIQAPGFEVQADSGGAKTVLRLWSKDRLVQGSARTIRFEVRIR